MIGFQRDAATVSQITDAKGSRPSKAGYVLEGMLVTARDRSQAPTVLV